MRVPASLGPTGCCCIRRQATGSTGSVSFSVGEVDYKTQVSGSNIITEGLQQTYINPNKAALISNLKLYPNPASTTLNLTITCEDNAEYLLTILDIYGRVMKSKKAGCIKTNGYVQWNVSDLTPGTYIIKVAGKNIKGIPFIKL